jgi:LacI family transcriptional regulator
MRKSSRITKKQIAEKTGLSISTVDRVLNNRGNVKPETYRRVVEAAKELQYVVNQSASLLSRGIQISIAVVLLEYPQFFWEQVEKGVYDAFSELRDYGLSGDVIRIQDEVEVAAATIEKIINSGKHDGLALPAGNDAYVDVIDRSIDSGFPIATLNIDSPTSKRLFYVGCNYHIAGRLAAELLCKLIGGSGKVTLVTDSWTSFQSHQKITGFREVLTKYPLVKMAGPLKMERGESAEALLALADELASVDGIYVSNAELETIAELKTRINPHAVLIGHDMNPKIYSLLNTGEVTATICQDPVAQGYIAVKTLFNHLALNKEIDVRENITKLEVVVKENARFYI